MIKWHKAKPFLVNYCVCSINEFKEWCVKNKQTPHDIPDNHYGTTIAKGGKVFVVLGKHKTQWELIDTVIHESVHVYQAIIEYVGDTITSVELPAYFIAEISTNLLKDCNALHDQWKTRL